MLHLPLAAVLLATAASARYYILHPQGQSDYCLAIDPCGGPQREYPLVTAQCDGSDGQKWGTRLIGDTETITWYPLSESDRCINGNSEYLLHEPCCRLSRLSKRAGDQSTGSRQTLTAATTDPPQQGQQVVLAPCTPDQYNKWQDWARDGNQLVSGSLDQTRKLE